MLLWLNNMYRRYRYIVIPRDPSPLQIYHPRREIHLPRPVHTSQCQLSCSWSKLNLCQTISECHLAIVLMFLGPTTALNSGSVVLLPRPRPPPPLPRLFRAIALVKRWALDRAFGCPLIFFSRTATCSLYSWISAAQVKIMTLLYLFDHAGHNQIRWWILREMVCLCVCMCVFVFALVSTYATVVVHCSGMNSLLLLQLVTTLALQTHEKRLRAGHT